MDPEENPKMFDESNTVYPLLLSIRVIMCPSTRSVFAVNVNPAGDKLAGSKMMMQSSLMTS